MIISVSSVNTVVLFGEYRLGICIEVQRILTLVRIYVAFAITEFFGDGNEINTVTPPRTEYLAGRNACNIVNLHMRMGTHSTRYSR